MFGGIEVNEKTRFDSFGTLVSIQLYGCQALVRMLVIRICPPDIEKQFVPGWAFLQTFCVMIGENWVTIMYDVSFAYGSKYATWYFLFIVVLGDYFFLNLVLAVVLSVDTLEEKFTHQKTRIKLLKAFEMTLLRHGWQQVREDP